MEATRLDLVVIAPSKSLAFLLVDPDRRKINALHEVSYLETVHDSPER